MRIWAGTEVEGKAKQGIKTLFVEAPYLSLSKVALIKKKALQVHAHRIYFGAGKVNVRGIEVGFFECLKQYELVLEGKCTPFLLNLSKKVLFVRFVLRFETQEELPDLYSVKIETPSKVLVWEYEPAINLKNGLKNGLYESDILL